MTRSQLKQVIKEELGKVLFEAGPGRYEPHVKWTRGGEETRLPYRMDVSRGYRTDLRVAEITSTILLAYEKFGDLVWGPATDPEYDEPERYRPKWVDHNPRITQGLKKILGDPQRGPSQEIGHPFTNIQAREIRQQLNNGKTPDQIRSNYAGDSSANYILDEINAVWKSHGVTKVETEIHGETPRDQDLKGYKPSWEK